MVVDCAIDFFLKADARRPDNIQLPNERIWLGLTLCCLRGLQEPLLFFTKDIFFGFWNYAPCLFIPSLISRQLHVHTHILQKTALPGRPRITCGWSWDISHKYIPINQSYHSVARQCVHCCKGDAASQWEMAILGVSEFRNPWTDRLKIWHMWLRRWVDLVCQISWKSAAQGLAGNMVKMYTLRTFFYIFL